MRVEIIAHTPAHAWLCEPDVRQLRRMLERMRREIETCGHVLPSLSLHLVDDGGMARANARHLGCTGPTNVLSFPGDASLPGQMLLSLPTWRRECLIYGQDGTEHLLRLLAHGMAHLAGLDHGPDMDALSARCLRAACARFGRGWKIGLGIEGRNGYDSKSDLISKIQ